VVSDDSKPARSIAEQLRRSIDGQLADRDATIARLREELEALGRERDDATADIVRHRERARELESVITERNAELAATGSACRRFRLGLDAAREELEAARLENARYLKLYDESNTALIETALALGDVTRREQRAVGLLRRWTANPLLVKSWEPLETETSAFLRVCGEGQEGLEHNSDSIAATPSTPAPEGPRMLPGQRCTWPEGHVAHMTHSHDRYEEREWATDHTRRVPRCPYVAPTPAVPATTPVCAPYCGTPEASHAEIRGELHLGAGTGRCFCSPRCRDLGHPRNPPPDWP
jgi:hypothetical protein